MQIPLQISFRNMPRCESVESDVTEQAAKLEQLHDRITRCDVVISTCQLAMSVPRHYHYNGNLYHVRVDISISGNELEGADLWSQDPVHDDVYTAIREAFNAAGRRLEDRLRETGGKDHPSATPASGPLAPLGWSRRYLPSDTPKNRRRASYVGLGFSGLLSSWYRSTKLPFFNKSRCRV